MEAEGISSPVLAVEGRFLKATSFPDELVFEGTSTHCFFGADGKPLLIQKQMPDFWAELGL